MAPVTAPALQQELDTIFDVNLADDRLAWTLDADGIWRKVTGTVGIDTHTRLQELALEAGER
jgi:polyphosphate kinase